MPVLGSMHQRRAAGESGRVGQDRGSGEAGAVRAEVAAVRAGGRARGGVRDRERLPGAAGVLGIG